MIAKYLLPAVAVIGSAAAAQCSTATATVASQAEATQLSSCSTFKGSILVNTAAQGDIDLSGIQRITGDLICENNGAITSLKSTSLSTIDGAFTLTNLTGLSNLEFASLTSVSQISWRSLNAIDTLNFGAVGVTQAKSVEISDTFLSTLDGIDLTTVDTLNINNNNRLTEFNSKLGNLTKVLNIQANGQRSGQGFKVSLPNLIWIADMTIANVSSFEVPSLAVVNGSARFDSNTFESFIAPNLTSTKSGDISFVGNSKLTNVSVPAMTQIGGGLLIANNTAMSKIDGFPKLKTIFGAVKLRGNFTSIKFPALNDVRGAFDVSSTNDIDSSCDDFKKLAPSKQGGGGQIQGTFACTSNNENANEDTGRNTTSGGKGSSGSGKDNSGVSLGMNTAILSLAVVGGLVALL